jgi:hypothetical protein
MEKGTVYINRETLLILGVCPDEAIRAILNKKAIDIHPYHVKALEVLKPRPVHSS